MCQEGVAIEIAEAVVGALKGELAATAVNAPMVPAEVSRTSTTWLFGISLSLLSTFYPPICFLSTFNICCQYLTYLCHGLGFDA